MGNSCCTPETEETVDTVKSFKKPRWKSEHELTEEELERMRNEFWDTEPHYGGNKVIWDALRAACEADLETAKVILDSAGIIVTTGDMRICYDERGCRYSLPKYVLCNPENLKAGATIGNSNNDSNAHLNGDMNNTPQVQLATRV